MLGLKLFHVSKRGSIAVLTLLFYEYSGILPVIDTRYHRTCVTLQWRHNERDGVSNHRLTIAYSTVCSGTDERTLQSSASVAFVKELTDDRLIPRTKGQ